MSLVEHNDEILITREMLDAGTERLAELLQAGTSSEYTVSEIYRAMIRAKAN